MEWCLSETSEDAKGLLRTHMILGQTKQWIKDKKMQWFTKNYTESKEWSWDPHNNRDELRCSESSSCSTSGNRRVTHV